MMSTMSGTDHDLALHIRDQLRKLRSAIEDAQSAGLTVDVPELVHLYLTHGAASGGPLDWKVCRQH